MLSRYFKQAVLSLAFLIVSVVAQAQVVTYYVKCPSGSDSDTGTSWGTAYRTLAKALFMAKASSAAVVNIWVTEGNYGPTDGLPGGWSSRQDTAFEFYRGNGVGKALKIFGGFAGTETSVAARTSSHTSYLTANGFSGAYNTYHIGIIAGLAPGADSLVLDGFTIANARTLDTGTYYFNGIPISNANGAGINMTNDSTGKVSIRNCVFSYNRVELFLRNSYGGGISVVNSALNLDRCTFIYNSSQGQIYTSGTSRGGEGRGGGLYADGATLRVRRCTWTTNNCSAGRDVYYNYVGHGGAVYLDNTISTFDTCTFSSNVCYSYGATAFGGAVSINNCSPVFTGCNFTNNRVTGYSSSDRVYGATIFNNGGNPVFNRCNFTGNMSLSGPAYTGGGTATSISYGGVIASFSAQPVMNKCTFNRNSANGSPVAYTGKGIGGVAYVTGGRLSIVNSVFLKDSADYGGAVYNDRGRVSVDSCSFDSCVANYGGVFFQVDSFLTLRHNLFQHTNSQYGSVLYAYAYGYHVMANSNVFTNNAGYQGGALYFYGRHASCTDTLINNVFAKNKAAYGGALWLGYSRHFIGNNTFYADTVTGSYCRGGAIFIEGTGNSDSIVNNIFYHNYSDSGNVDTGWGATSSTYFASHNSFSSTNPRFRDTANLKGADNIWGTADDGLQLTTCSSSMDAGIDVLVPAGANLDIAYRPRIQGLRVNMGAYETNAPGNITGPTSVCVGASISLTDTTTGGTWSSNNPAVATVSASGTVTGVSQGNATISYLYACGTRAATSYITVQRRASAITGLHRVCVGGTVSLADSATGGTWSGGGSIASTDTAGLVTGHAYGTTVITYSLTNICGTTSDTSIIHVDRPVAAITGTDSVCRGSAVTLSDTVTGGTWVSLAPSIATVNTSGAVTGIVQGIAPIVYTVSNACGTSGDTLAVRVSRPAAMITGTFTLCAGDTAIFSDTTINGTWSSSATGIASIDGAGLITAVAQGTSVITYAVTNACGATTTTQSVTIQRTVSAIAGVAALCAGDTTVFADSATGGSWSSGSAGIASISSTGTIWGLSQGISVITYTVTNVCGTSTIIDTISVDRTAATITASADTICSTASITLTDSTTGGAWNSSNTAVAGINSAGVVTGAGAGITTISYTVTNSCGTTTATHILTAEAPVANTTGQDTICLEGSITLTNPSPGGTWASSDATVATVSGGVVTGIIPGIATIDYSITNACGTTTSHHTVNVLSSYDCATIAGIGILPGTQDIILYPNPASDVLNIASAVPVSITIAGIDGRMLLSVKDKKEINLRPLANGTYIVTITDTAGNLLKKGKLVIMR